MLGVVGTCGQLMDCGSWDILSGLYIIQNRNLLQTFLFVQYDGC